MVDELLDRKLVFFANGMCRASSEVVRWFSVSDQLAPVAAKVELADRSVGSATVEEAVDLATEWLAAVVDR